MTEPGEQQTAINPWQNAVEKFVTICRNLNALKTDLQNHHDTATTTQKKQELAAQITALNDTLRRADAFLNSLRQQRPQPIPLVVPQPNPTPQPVPSDPEEERLERDLDRLAPLVNDAILRLMAISDKQSKLSTDLTELETAIDQTTDAKSKNISRLQSDIGKIESDLAELTKLIKIETDALFLPILNVLGQDVQQIATIEARIKSYEEKNTAELSQAEKRELTSLLTLIAKLKDFLNTGKTAYSSATEELKRLKGLIDDLIKEERDEEIPKKRQKLKESSRNIRKTLASTIINNNNIVLSAIQNVSKELKALQDTKTPAKAKRNQNKQTFFGKVGQYNKIVSAVQLFSISKVEQLTKTPGEKNKKIEAFIDVAKKINKLKVVAAKDIDGKSLEKLQRNLSSMLETFKTTYTDVYGFRSNEARKVIEFSVSAIRSVSIEAPK